MKLRAARLAIVLAIIACSSTMLRAGTREASDKVRQGIAEYRLGDYKSAAATFALAEKALPNDPRALFDQAMAWNAQGEAEKAAEAFRKAALGGDLALAARCHYNLGCMASAKAKKTFGDHPDDAKPEVRKEGLATLQEAVGHFRDCIQIAPDHADARHNLELIRQWIKHMQSVWEERDRQKQRQEMGLVEFLSMLAQRERGLRTIGRALTPEPDSPKRRQALAETESAQRTLAEEIPHLKEKIRSTLSQPQGPAAQPGAASAPAQPSPEVAHAIEVLESQAEAIGKNMLAAADRLHAQLPADATKVQTEIVEQLDALWTVVVPYPQHVQEAVRKQQGLVDETVAAVDKPDPAHPISGEESSWEQRFVERWAKALTAKAKQGLPELEKIDPKDLAAAAPAVKPDPKAKPDPQAKPDAEAMRKQLEGMRKSMKKAIELGPKVEELSVHAAEHLQNKKFADARPPQEESLKLLKEIADPLAKEDSKDQDQKNQDQQNKDQKQDQQKQQDSPQPKPQPKPDANQERAEAQMRQVDQRQRERKEAEKQLQQYFYRPEKVEKDW